MKKRERNVDEMIGLVKKYQPTQSLLQSDEVTRLLQSSPSQTLRLDNHNQQSGRKRMMAIIGGLIAVGTFVFWSAWPGGDIPMQGGQHHVELITEQAPSASVPSAEELSLKGVAKKIQDDMSSLRGAKHGQKKGEKSIPKGEEELTPRPVPGFHISDLTHEELLRLGIISYKGRLEIEREERQAVKYIPATQRSAFESLGYSFDRDSVRFHYRTQIALGADPTVDDSIYGPIDERFPLEPIAIIIMDEDRNRSLLRTGGGSLDWLSPEEREGLMDELGRVTDRYPEKREPLKTDLLKRLISIHIPWTSTMEDGSERKQHLYIWYSPTREFFEALPERYQTEDVALLVQYVLNAPNYGTAEYARPVRIFPGHMAFKRSSGSSPLWQFDRSRDIDGIKMLQLTRQELEAIGFREGDTGFVFTMEQSIKIDDKRINDTLTSLGYNTDSLYVPVQFKFTLDTFNLDYAPIPPIGREEYPHKPVLFSNRWIDVENDKSKSGLSMVFTTEAPVLNRLGEVRENLQKEIGALYMWDDSAKDNAMPSLTVLNRLVPVQIELKSDEYVEEAKQNRGAEVVLWYVPTPEFVKALPERYREQLQRELDAISSVEAEGLPSSEVCNRVAGETILGFCRSSSGAIHKSLIWPNPVQEDGEFTLSYVLDADRVVSVTLHDLSGRFLQEIAGEQSRTSGKHSESLYLKRVQSGTYLVALRTDKGETAVQRIVVE
ncbi:MAG: T9SS type A sorting domain-containing protein [Candidatus Kapaibacterium sp.]